MYLHYPIFSLIAIFLGSAHAASNSTAPMLSARDLIAQSIEALGGSENLSQVSSVSYVGGDIYRSKSVMQTYSKSGMDVVVAATGSQNMTFSYDDYGFKQRIDVNSRLGSYWTFARPLLEDLNYSLVVNAGDVESAAVVGGSYTIWAADAPPQGYLDGILAAFLVNEGYKMSPLLMSTILASDNFTARQETVLTGEVLPAIHDASSNISVVMDPETSLPYIIRSTEDHVIFGSSTYDILLTDYKPVNGVQFPTRFKSILNNRRLLGDYRADEVIVNPALNSDVFTIPGQPLETNTPTRNAEYDFAEIAEWSTAHMWYGEWTRTEGNYTIFKPFADLPGLWHVDPGNTPPAYKQVILEFEDEVAVLDAPPHRSHIVIQWIKDNIGKPITYVWPSHHHHDHATGLKDYVNVGAKIIVLDEAKDYYAGIPGVQFATFQSDEPFTIRGDEMHATFIHMKGSFHAFDHSYVIITPSCLTNDSTMAIFDADHVTPTIFDETEQAAPMELLERAAYDRVADDAIVISAHEAIMPLQALVNTTGYKQAGFLKKDFRYGSSICQ